MAYAYPLDLDVTIVSAKHLKNVNWRNGDLKPYVVLYLDSDRRLATHSEDSGSTKHVWNERFTLPVTRPVNDCVLTIEIFHSRPSETPKPLVGSAHLPLTHLVDSDDSPKSFRTIELIRPCGRPQGKVCVKLAIKERPSPPPPRPPQQQDYNNTHQSSYYYSSAPPPPPPMAASRARDYREFSPSPYAYSDQYYPGYYYLPPPPRAMYNRPSNYRLPSGPSAPVDLSSSDDQKRRPPPSTVPRASNYGVPTGPSAPVDFSPYDHKQLQMGIGELSLEDNKFADKVEGDFASRESYSYGGDYRRNY